MREKGSAVLAAISVAALVSLLLAGAATFVMSHNSRVQREKDYQAALTLAEAGINYELLYATSNLTTTKTAHTAASPYTGSISGVEGNYKVWTEGMIGGAWAGPPNDMWIKSVGTVGNVSRTVAVTGQREGLFADFSVFGTKDVTFTSSTSTVHVTLGTNGLLSASASGTASIDGEVWYCGPTASGPSGTNVVIVPDPVLWPSVDSVVAGEFGSWSYLQAHCNNANLRQFKSSNGALTPNGTQSANFSATTYSLKNADFNKWNTSPSGSKAIIFPPGDYYFTDFSVSSTVTMYMDTGGLTTGTPGRVRIFMPSSAADSQDTLNCNILMTTTDGTGADRLKFRIYDGKKADISIAGTSGIYGGYYGIRDDRNASFTILGNSVINGSIISNHVKIGGGSVVNFPNPGMITDTQDMALWYGYGDKWQEMKQQTNGTVFVDGTSN